MLESLGDFFAENALATILSAIRPDRLPFVPRLQFHGRWMVNMAAIIKKLKFAVIRKQWISLSIISLARVKYSTQKKNRGYLTKKVFSFWCN